MCWGRGECACTLHIEGKWGGMCNCHRVQPHVGAAGPAHPHTLPRAARPSQRQPAHSDAFVSLSGRSRAPALRITQAPIPYSNRHETKHLNRFSFQEKTAQPTAPPSLCCPRAGDTGDTGTWRLLVPEAPTCLGSPDKATLCPALPPATPEPGQSFQNPDPMAAAGAPGAPQPAPQCRTGSAKASLKATSRRKAKNQPTTDFSESYNIWKTRRGGTAGAFEPSTRVTAHAKSCFSCFKLG